MEKNPYHPPELKDLGHLRNLVEQGRPKTAGGSDGNGQGESDKNPANAPVSDDFTRGRTTSDDSGGRSGRGE